MTTWRYALAALGLLAAGVFAQGPAQPAPGPQLEPVEVVEIQLRSLQHNDVPTADAGIERTWAFAHPRNREHTGPLDRFATMIRSPAYAPLLNHRHHSIEEVGRTESRALFLVTVVTAAGPVYDYRWAVERVESGPLAGAWMTTAVSAPTRRGESI